MGPSCSGKLTSPENQQSVSVDRGPVRWHHNVRHCRTCRGHWTRGRRRSLLTWYLPSTSAGEQTSTAECPSHFANTPPASTPTSTGSMTKVYRSLSAILHIARCTTNHRDNRHAWWRWYPIWSYPPSETPWLSAPVFAVHGKSEPASMSPRSEFLMSNGWG